MYMTVYKIKEEVYLDKYNKCYKNIVTINKNPNNKNLSNYLITISRQKLSPFQYNCPCDDKPHCLFAFKDPDNLNNLLKIDNIEKIFTILIDFGFTIEHNLTKLLKKKDEKLICFISK